MLTKTEHIETYSVNQPTSQTTNGIACNDACHKGLYFETEARFVLSDIEKHVKLAKT